MTAHERDIDADFLAIYGIDLTDTDIGGPRYFALVHRLSAYAGVMAARVQEAENDDSPAATQPAAEPARAQQPAGGEQQEMSLTAVRFKFPGLVSVAEGG